jgi:hypothetical protein
LRYNPPLVVLKLKISRYVQTHRHLFSASTSHTPVAYRLWGAIEKGIAGVLRIQETDRSVGLGDLVHNWVRDRVRGRRADSFFMAMTLSAPSERQERLSLCFSRIAGAIIQKLMLH